MNKKDKVVEILKLLKKEYKITGPFIIWSNPLELLIGIILSAQCTDVRVNIVTKELFKKYITASDYANADIKTLEKEIYSTGFYKSKAKALKETGRIITEDLNGEVPDNLEDLLKLRGVSHKTAYLVLAKLYDKNDGLAVDTHVFRLSKRFGLSDANTPIKMSKELSDLINPSEYLSWNEYLITHGRAICGRKPKCNECVLKNICDKNINK
ncbi:MAG: endonuclease III domain-containing protein [Candidatus Moraniibacteriota bacterium]|jgi:endonuclease III